MKTRDPDETRLLLEALETAKQLHAAGMLSDHDLMSVVKICEQPSSQSELIPLTAQQHALVAKARPRKRGKVVSSLLGFDPET